MEWDRVAAAGDCNKHAGWFRGEFATYNDGVFEIQVAPNNSNVMYMVYPVYESNTYPALSGAYKSTNEGATWTLTSFMPLNGKPA